MSPFFAPQDGVINQLNIREGFYVEPRTTMMSIGDLSEVWVDVEIFKSDLDKVQVGQIAKLEWFDDRTSLTSKVDFVYPEVDMITRTGKARLVISNPDRHFQPNDFAKVKILQDSPDLINQLSLPRESVIYVNGETRVVVANGNGKFDVRTVSVGPSDDSFVSVLNGLAEGERVVISAQFLLDSEASKSGELSRLQHEHMDHSEMDHSEMNHSEMNHSEMDHSEMDHSEMNHSEMNHSEMNHSEMNHSEMDHSQTKSKFPSATVDGVINSISLDSRMANISRGPIEKWGREATTMDFVIDSSIKIESLELNSSIQFTFEIRSGDFVVTEVSDSTSQ